MVLVANGIYSKSKMMHVNDVLSILLSTTEGDTSFSTLDGVQSSLEAVSEGSVSSPERRIELRVQRAFDALSSAPFAEAVFQIL